MGSDLPLRSVYNFSVRVKGKPRSPLKSFFNRRSLELLSRRIIPGATSWLLSRRARRPLSQSSPLIEPSIGMQGTFDFEFIGDFFHELHAVWKITVFRQIRKRRRRDIFVVPNPKQNLAPSGAAYSDVAPNGA